MELEAVFDQSVFDETLKNYITFSSRTLPVIVNTKTWYIARKANWFTHKASEYDLKSGLARVVQVDRLTKTGKTVRKMIISNDLIKGRSGAPLAALIIHARLRAANKPSPFKGVSRRRGAAEMLLMVRRLINARARSIGFFKSGFIPAIRTLEKFADRTTRALPPIDRRAKEYGEAKGDAMPAEEEWNCIATMVNNAVGRNEASNRALLFWGAKGLQEAFDDETRSMKEYIAMKLDPGIRHFNRAQQTRRMIVAT